MTMTELTHAYQHLAAQAGNDKVWMLQVEESITDHAVRLDLHGQHIARMDAAGLQLSKDLTRTGAELMAKVDETLEAFKPSLVTAEANDMELRKHVAAQDATMLGRLDKLEVKIQPAIDKWDLNLREHTQQAVQETTGALTDIMERMHIIETARAEATSGKLGSISPV